VKNVVPLNKDRSRSLVRARGIDGRPCPVLHQAKTKKQGPMAQTPINKISDMGP